MYLSSRNTKFKDVFNSYGEFSYDLQYHKSYYVEHFVKWLH